MEVDTTHAPKSPPSFVKPRFWTPLILSGASFQTWRRLLKGRGGRIYWHCWPCILLALGILLLRYVLRVLHNRRFRKQVAQMPETEVPIFVIGLWRSGT